MKDLHVLPKVKDSLSYIYIEHAKIKQDGYSIAILDKKGITPVPCATLNIIMLGPGTSITHSAIKNIIENDCLILWCGEEGVRFYAEGLGRTRSAKSTILQAMLSSIPKFRLLVAKNMYIKRFNEQIPMNITIKQLRGKEGSRMKLTYQEHSLRTGVAWEGRSYQRNDWMASDPINRALSVANSCLYGTCHAAIIALGYTPALGFIHTGKQLSFVYDIADLYKTEITIPLSFDLVKEGTRDLSRRVRITCREFFREHHLLKRIVKDIPSILDIKEHLNDTELSLLDTSNLVLKDYDADDALPGYLWDPQDGFQEGGQNYDESEEKIKQ